MRTDWWHWVTDLEWLRMWYQSCFKRGGETCQTDQNSHITKKNCFHRWTSRQFPPSDAIFVSEFIRFELLLGNCVLQNNSGHPTNARRNVYRYVFCRRNLLINIIHYQMLMVTKRSKGSEESESAKNPFQKEVALLSNNFLFNPHSIESLLTTYSKVSSCRYMPNLALIFAASPSLFITWPKHRSK